MPTSAVRPRRIAALGGLVGLGFLLALSSHAIAGDDEEEDKPTIEEKVIKNILGGLGVDVGQGKNIDYRERSPLVIPPDHELPPPQEAGAVKDPAWPKDPDQQPKKKTAAKSRNLGDSIVQYKIERGTATPDELRGTVSPGTSAPGNVTEPKKDAIDNSSEYGGRPLKPDELGQKKSLFSLSSFWGNKAESAPFTGEPARTSLTRPPAGYQTPSPQYPYGIGKQKNTSTQDMPQLNDRAAAPSLGK